MVSSPCPSAVTPPVPPSSGDRLLLPLLLLSTRNPFAGFLEASKIDQRLQIKKPVPRGTSPQSSLPPSFAPTEALAISLPGRACGENASSLDPCPSPCVSCQTRERSLRLLYFLRSVSAAGVVCPCEQKATVRAPSFSSLASPAVGAMKRAYQQLVGGISERPYLQLHVKQSCAALTALLCGAPLVFRGKLSSPFFIASQPYTYALSHIFRRRNPISFSLSTFAVRAGQTREARK